MTVGRALSGILLWALFSSAAACGAAPGAATAGASGGGLGGRGADTGAASASSGGVSTSAGGDSEGTGGSNGGWKNDADAPPAGIAAMSCAVPSGVVPSTPRTDHLVGSGTAASCTGQAVIDAVAQGGTITFDCGKEPVTITLPEPAKVYTDQNPDVIIDGGGLVTLSGGGTHRILYVNACDPALHFTTPHCQNQDHPRVTLQNLTFIDGDSSADSEYPGGGAVWQRGGRLTIVNSRFFNNRCAAVGPDLAGAAVYMLSPYNDQPMYIVNSTFGGAPGYGNQCANGGAIGSIGVSWTIINSLMSHNRALGDGGNPAKPGTPGGGSGGAIYNDGQTMTLTLCGTTVEENAVNAYGSGIIFVSNNHDGTLHIEDSVIRNNHGGSWYELPNISMHSDTHQEVSGSVIE